MDSTEKVLRAIAHDVVVKSGVRELRMNPIQGALGLPPFIELRIQDTIVITITWRRAGLFLRLHARVDRFASSGPYDILDEKRLRQLCEQAVKHISKIHTRIAGRK